MRSILTCGLTLAMGVMIGTSSAAAHENSEQDSKYGSYLHELKQRFGADSIVSGPELVDCKLSGGTETKCVSITVGTKPSSFATGPWCPRNIADGPDMAGIWLRDGKIYDADGAFIKNLAKFYDDDVWQLFNPKTGAVNVTDTKKSCAAAARPDVDPKYYNHCVECQPSYMKKGSTLTYVIPVDPVRASRPERIGFAGVGLALSGVRLDEPAPLQAILGAHTLAPFDHCGGHVNLHVGYHIHAVMDCLKKVSIVEDHAPMIGVALDGYSLCARLNSVGEAPKNLDSCRGHIGNGLGYHYHAAKPGKNQIIGCFTAETGCVSEDSGKTCDATIRSRRRP